MLTFDDSEQAREALEYALVEHSEDDLTVIEPGMCLHVIAGMWMDGYGCELSESVAVTDAGAEVLSRIVDQVTRPVRWDLCMEAMAQREVTGVLELLPGGTLTGLAKRGLKGTAQLAVKTPEDLDAARAFLAEHTA